MAKTKSLTVRMDPELKDDVEQILTDLGLSTSQAIVLFYKQVQLHQGLPFDVRLPNRVTREALADAESRKNLTAYASTSELFADLGI
jgi:DNA-damage-inducible protein J